VTLLIEPLLAAGTRSGTALARARSTVSATRWLVSVLPTPTGAGLRGLITVPVGTRIVTGLSQPSFMTECGSQTALSAYRTAALVTPKIALIGRGT
jgi:hypothetical protein